MRGWVGKEEGEDGWGRRRVRGWVGKEEGERGWGRRRVSVGGEGGG